MRIMHCRNYGGGSNCDYFEWVYESLDERVRSMVVGLMVSNDTMTAEIKKLENDLEARKHEVANLNEKNQRMKLKLYACLLYTSPSPRDGLLSRMPSSA